MVPPLNEDPVSNTIVEESLSYVSTTTQPDDSSASLLHTKNKTKLKEQEDALLQVSFSHVQLYVDHVKDLGVYKHLEDILNQYSQQVKPETTLSEKQQLYQSLLSADGRDAAAASSSFVPQNRDVIEQLLAGFGFRVTAARYPSSSSASDAIAVAPTSTLGDYEKYSSAAMPTTNTRSVLVTSKDGTGAQFVITALSDDSITNDTNETATQDMCHHFDAANLHRFRAAHANRQGIAVMGFVVDRVDLIRQRYQRLHPNLIHNYSEYHEEDCTVDGNGIISGGDTVLCAASAGKGGVVKILEVFAYYKKGEDGAPGQPEADVGTLLRFVERNFLLSSNKEKEVSGSRPSTTWLLPGLNPVNATFDDMSQPVYCDHWVSNVISRTGFLQTLEDTLGFTPKVDFNAGVVAAGEAQIESTVTGNDPTRRMADTKDALRDQSQVYLPINNALSEVGHVHGFLKEIGQGIQHVASRVENLVDFVQRGNDNRKITGEGFSFLNIPRSYYGVLSAQNLVEEVGLSIDDAHAIVSACIEGNVTSMDGAVDLTLSREDIASRLDNTSHNLTRTNDCLDAYHTHKHAILNTILFSRYRNLHLLLQGNVSEETYLGIVSNQILVDVQGEDLLYQIFTCNILQRNAGEEAPFFEFIQRVCSECNDENGCPVKVKPGCGGFGIRNFLTLFLSIEVSKAMLEASEAKACGDEGRLAYSQKRVDCFTAQLNESNPILTEISTAMTEEGYCQEQVTLACARIEEADGKIPMQRRRWPNGRPACKWPISAS